MDVLLKRAYDPAVKADGYRVLVDRLWPRGVSKAKLALDAWAKDVAPSTELRVWFGHDPKRWAGFQKRYRDELKTPQARAAIRAIAEEAKGRVAITLVYGARDAEHNEAVVLRAFVRRAALRFAPKH